MERQYAAGSETIAQMAKRRGCTEMGAYECQVPMPIDGRVRGIDVCIADIVAALNAANIGTEASCCGHGDSRRAWIWLKDGRSLSVGGLPVRADGPGDADE